MQGGDALNAQVQRRAKTQKAADMKFGAITNSWRDRLASASIEALVGGRAVCLCRYEAAPSTEALVG